MKYLAALCVLAIIPAEVIRGEDLSKVSEPAGRCQIWGRVIAPHALLDKGLMVEFTGNSMRRQKTNLIDGAFEFDSAPAGVYEFRVLDVTGHVILQQPVKVDGGNNRIVLDAPLPKAQAISTQVLLFRQGRKLPRKAIQAFRAGERAAQNGDWQTSLRNFQAAAAMVPHFTEAEGNVSVEYFRMGLLDDAIVYARKAYESDPELPATGYNLVILLINAKRYPEAEPVVRSMLQRRPDLIKLHGVLAASLVGQGHIEDAFEHLRVAVTEFPDERLTVANALLDAGRSDLAVVQVSEFLRTDASECERRYLDHWLATITRAQIQTEGGGQ